MHSQYVSFAKHVTRRVILLLYTVVALAWTSGAPALLAQTRPLNDTGQTQCYDATDTAVPVSAANCGDSAARPRQDARYGRDAQAAAGSLTKIGAGAAGFDFTKIANNGTTLAATATLGSAAAAWACTKDNVTGLIWEVKTATAGLRNSAHSYTWYSTDNTSNGGNVGTVGTATTCSSTLATCDTQSYVAAVNAATLCGASDWRLPSQKELLSVVHAGATNPSIDSLYFPNTATSFVYWTRSTYASNPAYAWVVYFVDGYSGADHKSNLNGAVLLVRGGQ